MGAALASVLGNIVSVVWFIYYLQRKSAVQSVSIKDFKPSKKKITADCLFLCSKKSGATKANCQNYRLIHDGDYFGVVCNSIWTQVTSHGYL